MGARLGAQYGIVDLMENVRGSEVSSRASEEVLQMAQGMWKRMRHTSIRVSCN